MSEKSARNQPVLAVLCELKPELIFGAPQRDPKLKVGPQTLVCKPSGAYAVSNRVFQNGNSSLVLES